MTDFQPTLPTQTMAEVILDIDRRVAIVQRACDDNRLGCAAYPALQCLVLVKDGLDTVHQFLAGQWDGDDIDPEILQLAEELVGELSEINGTRPPGRPEVPSTQEGRDVFRIHFASLNLVGVEHEMVEAEFFAGIQSRAAAKLNDVEPWCNHPEAEQPCMCEAIGNVQAEAERLRLSEGITFVFPENNQ